MAIDRQKVYEKQSRDGRLQERSEFPGVVLIDTVSYCNLRCSMCVHAEMKRTKGFMPWELFTKIIDEIALENKATRIWMVFFGEPFVLKRKKPTFFDMVRYAKDKGLTDVVVNSNANLMDEGAARGIIEAGLDAIYFGVDANTKETYDKLRVGGDFEKVRANIRRLIELKAEMKSATPDVFVQFVEMDSNTAEKDEFIRYWNALGAKVKIRPKVSWGGMIEAPNLVLGNEDRWPCHWAMQTLSVTDTGDVVTCAVDLDARYVAGNLTKQTIREVWNTTLKDLRTLHLEGRFAELPENCRDCRDWQSARSDYSFANQPEQEK